ncbi:MAG: cupin domain-containing protein [Candidatus Binatia bacterium]
MEHRCARAAGFAVVLSLAVFSGWPARANAGEAAEPMMAEQKSLKFAPIPGAPKCATAAAVRGDPSKGAAVLMIKLASGCRVPWHWHTANEQLMIVSGNGTLEMKEGKKLPLRAGAYAAIPGKHVHQATCSESCMFFNTTDGAFDIHYVDQAGKEITAEEALKKRPERKTQAK